MTGKQILTALETVDDYNRKKRVLIPLNNVFGFDFEKQFGVIEFDGKWTVNTVSKMATENGYNPSNSTIVLLMTYNGEKAYLSGRVYAIKIENGSYSYDYKFYCLKNYYNSLIDNFYRKSDIEEYRKSGLFKNYLICQKNEDLSGVFTRVSDYNIDLTQRFKFINKGYSKQYRTIDSGLTLDINRFGDGKISILDKSGYIAEIHRNELKRKAQQLRNERKQAEYNAINNDSIIRELSSRIDNLKMALLETFRTAKTSADFNELGKNLYFYGGMSTIIDRFEDLTETENRKGFSSVEEFEKRVANINRMIDEISGKIGFTITTVNIKNLEIMPTASGTSTAITA